LNAGQLQRRQINHVGSWTVSELTPQVGTPSVRSTGVETAAEAEEVAEAAMAPAKKMAMEA